MNTVAYLSLAVMALGVASPAFADADYSASFQLTEGLPALRTGTMLDGPHNLAGDWTSYSQPQGNVSARDLLGTSSGGTTWGEWRTGEGLHTRSGPPWTMGETFAKVSQLDYHTAGQAAVGWSSLSARAQTEGAGGEVRADAVWSRNFSLEANTSFTFAGLSTFDVLGDVAPLEVTGAFGLDPDLSFASVTMADALGRVGSRISADITSLFPSTVGTMFSYAIGADGLMSLTLNNLTGGLLTGTLSASSYVHVGGTPVALASSVAAPVPEPAAMLTLLAGLGLVGAAVRRQRPAARHA